MAPLSFTDLSVDIKSLIVAYVIRPTDMKDLCLVNKQLHEITVRNLYREVTLDVGSPADTKLSAFLNPRNIGLQYIRQLDLYLADINDKCNQLQQANFAVRMIIEFLPENILEKLSWHPWSTFSADNLLLLYRKQRRMQWMEAIAMDRDVVPELEKLPDIDSIVQGVKKLGLYPDNREVLNLSHFLLKRTSKLDKLTLHASFEDHEPPIPTRELNDSSTEPGLITRTIFSHLQPFSKCTPLALKELALQKINLRYAAQTYCKIINFSTVKLLRVCGCPGADALFAELSKSTALPEKLETLEFKHDDNPENDAMNALDGFLCLVSGIKTMTLDISYAKSLPAHGGITRHSRTLRELNVHASRGDSDDEELVFELEAFQQICKECTKVEQLSAAFPSTSLIRANSESFTAFETALKSIPHLITLNITTWPTNQPSTSRLPRHVYEHLLQALAQTQLEQHAHLSIVAFGASNRVYEREDSNNIIIFVRGRQFGPFGKELPLAVQVGWCLRRFVEPRSDVLDFALSRSSRPPTREPPPSDDSDGP